MRTATEDDYTHCSKASKVYEDFSTGLKLREKNTQVREELDLGLIESVELVIERVRAVPDKSEWTEYCVLEAQSKMLLLKLTMNEQ